MAIVAELERGPQGLGISLAGHKDRTKMAVLICGLNPSTVVYRSTQGTLQVGDEIVEASGFRRILEQKASCIKWQSPLEERNGLRQRWRRYRLSLV
ncbi:unnamed protein product [Nezara viridula]|uniref:PDZ domain-containing protein n=1 Tax=Nezara viridula TaxID=85310 RepID=A0A9P0H055_NEZVI|nr:unnamed protein product [Nezara viridula]